MAQKRYNHLLPIVVTCALHAHAQAVLRLNDVLKNIDPNDAHSLAYAIQNSDLDVAGKQIYAIMFSEGDTGVYDGINW